MSEEDDFRLRDQLAMVAMQALLGKYKQEMITYQYKQKNNVMAYTNHRIDGTEYSKTENGSISTNHYETEADRDYIARIETKIELISDLAYKIADEMRKARLKSFT